MATVTDLYPTRGSTEVVTERGDPVVWPASAQEIAAGPRAGERMSDDLRSPVAP